MGTYFGSNPPAQHHRQRLTTGHKLPVSELTLRLESIGLESIG